MQHKFTGKQYAVKCFEKVKLLSVEKGMLSLYNELKILRALIGHTNVMQIYEAYEG